MKKLFLITLFIVLSAATFAQVDSTKSVKTDYTISCYQTENSGSYSSAIGSNSQATAMYSIAGGYRAKASGEGAVSFGYLTNALGTFSTAIGQSARAEGNNSFSVGASSSAIGEYSIAFGKYVQASAAGSMAIGIGAGSGSYVENSKPNSLLVAFNTTNPTFFVDGATSSFPLGRVGIGTDAPATTLDVNGTLRISGNSTFGTPEENNKMYVNGEIYTNELIVNAESWPDYVFAPNYNLRKLEEVEEFIAQNGHLPDVPNQAEVLENGHKVAAMDAILLQKIEELTLYMIELKKENEKLKERLEVLEK